MIKNKLLQTKNKSLQAKCYKLQPKSELNHRRPDTSTERIASGSVADE